MNRVCVYGICKNEEKKVGDWINSVKDADLICLTDTGSTDNTINIITDFEISKDNELPDGKHVKFIHYEYKQSADFKYFNFGAARQFALKKAKEEIEAWDKYDSEENRWIMVCLDMDETPIDNFINNVRGLLDIIPDNKNFVIPCQGLTKTEDENYSSQIVTNKIHTCIKDIDNTVLQWDRYIHERIVSVNFVENTMKKAEVLNLDNQAIDLNYIHNQDLSKQRNYYESLKDAYELGDHSSLTCIYLAWEAGLHPEVEGSKEDVTKYSYECIKAALNPEDLDYGDWENISQAFINIISRIPVDSIKNINRIKSVLDSCIKIIDDKIPDYKPNRRMYNFIANSYESLFTFICNLIPDNKFENEEEKEELLSISTTFVNMAIIFYKKVLGVNEPPICWFDDRKLYEDDNQYVTKLTFLYGALGDTVRATTYAVIGANNSRDENMLKELKVISDTYLNIFKDWVINSVDYSLEDIKNEVKFKYLNIEPEEEVITGNVGGNSDYQPLNMQPTTPASIGGIDSNKIIDINNFTNPNDEVIMVDRTIDPPVVNIEPELQEIINNAKEETVEDIINYDDTKEFNVIPEKYPYDGTNKVCIYAMCKNELKFVDSWIDSMKEADCICVLDTGSTDGTWEKLQDIEKNKEKILGNCEFIIAQKVINPWRFDVARNESLKLVPPEYNILMSTDLDELLEAGWAQVLRDKWEEGVHKRGVYKYSWSHRQNGESARVFQYDKIHSREWIWKYPCHELLWNTETNTNAYSNNEVLYVFDEIHLHHYPDFTKSRSNYLPLLELRAKENPDDYYGLIYLAHEYSYKYHHDKSTKLLTYILEHFKDRCTNVEEASCYLFMGDNYQETRRYEQAIENYDNAIAIDETYREPYINKAKVLMELKKFEEAIECINTAIQKGVRHFVWVERDASWTWEPFDLLSLCYFYKQEQNLVASYVFASRAAQYDPFDERLQKNVNLILKHMDDKTFIANIGAK